MTLKYDTNKVDQIWASVLTRMVLTEKKSWVVEMTKNFSWYSKITFSRWPPLIVSLHKRYVLEESLFAKLGLQNEYILRKNTALTYTNKDRSQHGYFTLIFYITQNESYRWVHPGQLYTSKIEVQGYPKLLPPSWENMETVENEPSNIPWNIFNLKNIWRRSDFLLFYWDLTLIFPKRVLYGKYRDFHCLNTSTHIFVHCELTKSDENANEPVLKEIWLP